MNLLSEKLWRKFFVRVLIAVLCFTVVDWCVSYLLVINGQSKIWCWLKSWWKLCTCEPRMIRKPVAAWINVVSLKNQTLLVPWGIEEVTTSFIYYWYTDAQVHPGHRVTLRCFTGKAWHLSFIRFFSHHHHRVCMEIVFISIQTQVQVSSANLFLSLSFILFNLLQVKVNLGLLLSSLLKLK